MYIGNIECFSLPRPYIQADQGKQTLAEKIFFARLSVCKSLSECLKVIPSANERPLQFCKVVSGYGWMEATGAGEGESEMSREV